MTNYEGEMISPSDQTKIPMELAFDSDKIFDLTSIHIADYDTAVDSTVIGFLKLNP